MTVHEALRVLVSVEEFGDDGPLDRLQEVSLDRPATHDGTSAIVTLSCCWRPPIVTLFVP